MTRNTIFWIVGWLLGLGIIVIYAVPKNSGPGIPASTTTFRALSAQVITACRHYRHEYGTLPITAENYILADILNGNNPKNIRFIGDNPKRLNKNKEFIDYWETPIRIIFCTNNIVQCISAGKDRQFNTSDDIGTKMQLTEQGADGTAP